MWSKIFVVTQVILAAQSITVPPVWPKQNAHVLRTGNVRLPIQHSANLQPKNFAIENLHSVPIAHHQNHETVLPSVMTPALQYRSPNNQEVYIYHPRPTADADENIPLDHKPSSYQIVKSENQGKDVIVRAEPTSDVEETEKYLKKTYAENVPLVKKSGIVEGTETRRDTIREHEFPRDVPTKPIYPGEGKWSDYRLRHTPYVANNKDLPKPRELEPAKRPEGYDTFEKGQEQFQQARNQFHHDLDRFPETHNLNPSPNDEDGTELESSREKPEIEFVPQKLYAQVRRTESEQHLPKSAIDPDEQEENAGRLREVIKDSKIHTVYTEEGYEDSAYDHAGHEKHAENAEGHAQLAEDEEVRSPNGRKGGARSKHSGGRRNGRGRTSESRKVRNKEQGTDVHDGELVKYKNSAETDADSAMESKRVEVKLDELPMKNMQKVTLQTGDKESIDMEIHTEVKYVPGAPRKKHKFVKIIPSYKKHIVEPKTEGARPKSLRRVKRYNKDDLSKRYVRKRPNYYWKKVKTSTTERPLLHMRRKFEAALKNHNGRSSSTERPVNDNTTPASIVAARTISGTTVTSTSTTPMPPATRAIEDLLEAGKVPAKSLSPNSLKVKLKKTIVKRQKRFAIDLPNVDVDLKEFVDVKALPNPTVKPDLTFVKYPYYKAPVTDTMNIFSPLRYAEDMANIPRKTNDLSFYESRSHILCPEIESNVDPIPDRVKKQENGEGSEETDDEDNGQLRLSGLGDKIDCLKVKYFGENPLDSPLFQEDVVDEPILLLKNVKKEQKNTEKVPSDIDPRKFDMTVGINEKINVNDKNSVKLSPEKQHDIKNDFHTNQATLDRPPSGLDRMSKRELRVKILKPIIVLDEDVFGTTTLNPIHRKSDAVLRPPHTLLEMMKKIQPKNIYDQITILEQEGDKSPVLSDGVRPLREKFVVVYDQDDRVTTEHALEQQIKLIQPAVNGYKSPKVSDILSDLTLYSRHIEQPDVVNLLAVTSTKTKPTVSSQTVQEQDDSTKKPLAPKVQKISARKPVQNVRRISNSKLQWTTLKPEVTKNGGTNDSSIKEAEETTESSLVLKNPYVQITRRSSLPYIFDISRYLPQVPNHRLITSEVHYKDEIKPSEQMSMYTDVLKTINDELSSAQPNVTSAKSTEQASAGSNVHDDRVVQNKEKQAQFSSTKSIIHSDRIQEASDKIVDLVPPSNGLPYRTVLENPGRHLYPTFQLQNVQSINYNYVLGLKPPADKNTFGIFRQIKRQNAQPLKEAKRQTVTKKIHNSTPLVHVGNGRLKRDTSGRDLDDLMAEESRIYEVTPPRKPKVYTEIVRAKSAITEKADEEDDSEDLNPRKRVYELKPPTSVSTENTISFEELIDDETETDAPTITTTTTTSEPVIYPVEANSDNPSLAQYVFLIDRLHDKWERENPSTESIPETTPKPTEGIQAVAESINVPAGEPAFLQIINQLHNVREDAEKQNPPSTTTAASGTVEEDAPAGPVKNSNPYVLESGMPESFMSELTSMQEKLDPEKSSDNPDRLRNFSAKFNTAIDTSKYKTIERNPVSFRHNLSSRYNAEDQELPLTRVHTTQVPISTTRSDVTTRQPTEEPTTTKADTEITTARPRKPLRSSNRSTTTPTSVASFRRRRPTRVTTEATLVTTRADILHSRRRSRFRPESQNRPPASEARSKPVYTSTTPAPRTEEAGTTDTAEDTKKQRRLQTIHERRVVSEVTLTRFYEPGSDESAGSGSSSNENVEESKQHQYQIAGPAASVTEIYSDPELAKHVNQLKDGQHSTSTERPRGLSSVNKEDVVGRTSTNGVSNLYPNMARMINRLADSMASLTADTSGEDDTESSSAEDKPLFIKDPSKRMYYYARL